MTNPLDTHLLVPILVLMGVDLPLVVVVWGLDIKHRCAALLPDQLYVIPSVWVSSHHDLEVTNLLVEEWGQKVTVGLVALSIYDEHFVSVVPMIISLQAKLAFVV